MKSANQYLENTFPQITKEVKFQKWITAKQVDFFASVCGLQDVSKFKAEGYSRKFFVGNTDKYDIEIYVSPVNNCGSITITNVQIVSEQIRKENDEKIVKLQAELKESVEALEQLEVLPKSQRGVYKNVISRKIEELQREIKTLS